MRLHIISHQLSEQLASRNYASLPGKHFLSRISRPLRRIESDYASSFCNENGIDGPRLGINYAANALRFRGMP